MADTTGVSGAVTGGFGTGTPAGATTDNSWMSTLGNIGSGIGNWISNNQGLLGGLATGAVGLYQAGQATKQGQQAAGQIQQTVNPALQTGQATYGQLTGGAKVGGPMGQAIAGQTGAAQNLLGVANQYSTGQLTSAQQTQIQAQVQAERAQADQQLAASGNMNSSARDAKYQQIDNNAAILSQQLINQNLQMAEGAQTSVMNTYNSLLSNALSQSELGLRGTSTAVQTALQNDQQVQQMLQQIMSGIATQLGTASGGGKVAGGTPGQQAGGAIGAGLQKLFGGGGGAVAQPQYQGAGSLENYMGVASLGGQAAQSSADIQAGVQNYQPTLDLSSMNSQFDTGWGGYTANNIDYTGYTGG